MKSDRPLLAALFGILSTLPYEFLSRILLFFGIGKYSEYQLSSMVITLNRPTAILGFFVSSILGSTSALLFYYVIQKVGSDYLIVKGIAVGLIAFLFLEATFTAIIEGPGFIPFRPISDYYLHLFGAAVFGFTLGLLFRKGQIISE